jgi:hypothetical protein
MVRNGRAGIDAPLKGLRVVRSPTVSTLTVFPRAGVALDAYPALNRRRHPGLLVR